MIKMQVFKSKNCDFHDDIVKEISAKILPAIKLSCNKPLKGFLMFLSAFAPS